MFLFYTSVTSLYLISLKNNFSFLNIYEIKSIGVFHLNFKPPYEVFLREFNLFAQTQPVMIEFLTETKFDLKMCYEKSNSSIKSICDKFLSESLA